jgi:hypothetical protein
MTDPQDRDARHDLDEPRPSRLRHETGERQNVEELVPDGMIDEANVEDDGAARAAEEAAVRVGAEPEGLR